MQNARSMPAITPGRGIVLRSYLSTRPVSPAPSAINPCVKMSSNSPPEASRRISFPRCHLQRSSVRNCGGRTLVQESPIEWRRNLSSVRPLAVTGGAEEELDRIGKPENCMADELHYVAVPRTAWRLALWRYVPPKSAPKREHPVLMLSGIGTNAIGFDLDSNASLARHLSEAGFDTWILEVWGAGLSKREGEPTSSELGGTDGAFSGAVQAAFDQATIKNATQATENRDEDAAKPEKEETILERQSNPLAKLDEPLTEEDTVGSRMTNRITQMSQTLRSYVNEVQTSVLISKFIEQVTALLEDKVLNERFGELRDKLTGLLEGPQTNSVASQVTEFRKRVTLLLEQGQRSVTPSVTKLHENLTTAISDFQEVLELIDKYDWDFDTILKKMFPLLWSMLSATLQLPMEKSWVLVIPWAAFSCMLCWPFVVGEGAGLAGAVSLASSLDSAVSDTSLKMLLPLTDPAQMLHVPVIPLGALMNAIHPLSSRPPYALAYLGYQVSARGMMEPDLFKKLVCNNFCTIPVKLLLQLATVFKPEGLQNREGTVVYKDGLHDCKVPVLAIAGDQDLICPPIAVTETLKAFPQSNVMYKVFGGEDERHYGHYDLLCAVTAKQEVYPVILDFLTKCDSAKADSSA